MAVTSRLARPPAPHSSDGVAPELSPQVQLVQAVRGPVTNITSRKDSGIGGLEEGLTLCHRVIRFLCVRCPSAAMAQFPFSQTLDSHGDGVNWPPSRATDAALAAIVIMHRIGNVTRF